MRALIVGASPCDGRDADLILTRLSSESDLLIAADGGAEKCLRADLTPDLVVGDFDSVTEATLQRLGDAGSKIERFPIDKDASDLDLAIDAAREGGADEIVLTCVLGGRLDHLLALVGSLLRSSDLRPLVVEPEVSVWVLHASHRSAWSQEGRGRRVSILPIGGAATVSAEGVRWPLDAEALYELGSRGLSNIIESAAATITVHAGTILVITDLRV